MAEAHQARMQNEVEEMVQSLERDHIRKMQVKQTSAVTDARASHCVSLTLSCVSASGSHVQLQRGLLQPELRLHVSGPSVHRQVSCSSGPSPGSGHCRAGEVSGDDLAPSCLLKEEAVAVALAIDMNSSLHFVSPSCLNLLSRLQDRLTRCTMHCNDKAKDLFDSGAKEPAVRSLMERCVGSCVDDHVNLIPSMTRRLKETLDSIGQ